MINNYQVTFIFFLLLCYLLVIPPFLLPQSQANEEIKTLIQAYKKDERGPYLGIRWFCPDGRVLPANQPCGQPGAIQHALHKDIVRKIAKEQKIYLGQILAGTSYEDFLDVANQKSRLKQYQLEKYLQRIDDGWIMRRARYYRGALQAEDEENWGIFFLKKALADPQLMTSQFFLIRQVSKDIPHKTKGNRWERIRALATTIADSLPAFTDLRIKLHGLPDPGDAQRVNDFRIKQHDKILPSIENRLQELERELELSFRTLNLQTLKEFSAKLPAGSPVLSQLSQLVKRHSSITTPASNSTLSSKCRDIAELLWHIRMNFLTEKSINARLILLDLSVELESILFHEVNSWQPQTIAELLEKSYLLVLSAAGCGFIETWEWQDLEPLLLLPEQQQERLVLSKFVEITATIRRVTEWASGMVRANYDPEIKLFGSFEPLVSGFIDDRIRASILLPLGETAGQLADLAAQYAELSNQVMGIKHQNQIRGLNPGFALGELVVVRGSPENVKFSDKNIYLLQRAPADLKPVAGIATVSEGNLVSHVQLLARNLGIPNARISSQNLIDLADHSGKLLFYAVSPGGTVVMKPAAQMTSEERALVVKRQRSEDKIMAPVDKLNLKQTRLIPLSKLRAKDSGKICGPKAANLGELKHLFPERVGEGLVIPFGIFRQHLDQSLPGMSTSYWEFVQAIFKEVARRRKKNVAEEEIDTFLLQQLSRLHQAIKNIPLLPAFEEHLFRSFFLAFGEEIGNLPVFIRSDTNMEDLKDFTGAGLNLTVFNVVEKDKILQGIRDVWASPYTERSYRWRQQYLLNPENVFPSILILPTVNVDKSGVLITTGIVSSDPRDLTVAFNRGAGGAVEGQAAESYLLRNKGATLLLSPCREMKYNILPETGGTQKGFANFNQRILQPEELEQLRELAQEIKRKLSGTAGIDTKGPFDVELGFQNGNIWLFQVRPYVENARAASNTYLQNLDTKLSQNMKIPLDGKLP